MKPLEELTGLEQAIIDKVVSMTANQTRAVVQWLSISGTMQEASAILDSWLRNPASAVIWFRKANMYTKLTVYQILELPYDEEADNYDLAHNPERLYWLDYLRKHGYLSIQDMRLEAFQKAGYGERALLNHEAAASSSAAALTE